MTILSLLLTIVVFGVVLWAINKFASPYMAPSMLRILNNVAVIVVVLWLLSIFGVFDAIDIPVPRIK